MIDFPNQYFCFYVGINKFQKNIRTLLSKYYLGETKVMPNNVLPGMIHMSDKNFDFGRLSWAKNQKKSFVSDMYNFYIVGKV